MDFKIIHTCIRVFNLEESIKFYKDALGFKVSREMDKPDENFKNVYLVDKYGDFEIELTYNYDQEIKYDLGNGYSHLAVHVDDINKAYEFHKKLNIDMTDIYWGRLYFISDPDGYKIEILAPEK